MLLFSLESSANDQTIDLSEQQVKNAEVAFAKTMADRDLSAFESFVSEEAVFILGKNRTAAGKNSPSSGLPCLTVKTHHSPGTPKLLSFWNPGILRSAPLLWPVKREKCIKLRVNMAPGRARRLACHL